MRPDLAAGPRSGFGPVFVPTPFVDLVRVPCRVGPQRAPTAQADVDAVFFPDRLRTHLVGLGPPADTPLYLHNINFRFHFMGALEVLSTKAVDVLLANFADCAKNLGRNGGEDFGCVREVGPRRCPEDADRRGSPKTGPEVRIRCRSKNPPDDVRSRVADDKTPLLLAPLLARTPMCGVPA